MNPANDVALENERPRVDIRQKITGAARYTADQQPARMIFAKAVRFPYGAGKVVSADVEAAKKVKGVLEVEVDMEEVAEYPGAPIGHIVAESRAAIEDAEEALALKFERTAPKTDPVALHKAPESPQGGVFEGAAAVVEGTWRTQVQTHSCLEPHGSVVDHRGASAEVWGSTQTTFGHLDGMKGPTGLDASQIVVHCEYVGGGFGSKFGIGREGDLAARMSKKYQRPCKAMLDRSEEHLDGGNRPGSIQYIKLAADKDGKLLGGRMDLVSIVGHGRGGGGVAGLGDVYDLGAIEETESEINLNFAKPRAFRAPGWPQAVFALEGALDALAAKLGMDPIAFRIKNDKSQRRKERQYRVGADLIGWKDRKPDGTATGRVRRGFGMGSALWPTWPTKCGAQADIFRSGRVEVRVGVQDIGTGTFTLVTDVAAHELGIDRDLVTGRVGDSRFPAGPGSGGSQVSRSAAPATVNAVRDALDQLKASVASEWKIDKEKVKYGKGTFSTEDGAKKLEWAKACALLADEKVTGNGRTETGTEGSGTSDCVQFAEVEVDTETGIVRVKKIVAVHAAGVVVNRLTFENQICGGVIQGISYALFENVRLDPKTGAMVNADFIGYKIAGSKDIPEIVPVLDVEPGDTGVRPIGEPSTIPTAAAIANAVSNAIGARIMELPITPQRVLAALESKGGAA